MRCCAGRDRLVSPGASPSAKDKPDAAARLATRIVAVVEALRNHPYLGRAGAEPGIRELVIGGTPYIVLYRVRGNRITITTIWHAAQRNR